MPEMMAAAVAAFVVTTAAAVPLRRLALRAGILDRPGYHKSHSAPVPYLGGVAVLLGAAASILGFHTSAGRALALVSLLAVLGLFDDLHFASVPAKLIVQFSVGLAAVALGYSWHITDSPLINGGISIIWLVGLSNSFNLLDNMDGLCCATAATSLLGIGLISPPTQGLAIPFAAAALGFLLVNVSPWRMFLGDAGSLPIGLAVGLASIVLANQNHGLHSVVLLVFPVIVAVFDTSLVIVSRLMTHRPVQLGGRDHFSHRLRRLGWSQWSVLAAAVLAQTAGLLIAELAGRYPLAEAWISVPLAALLLAGWLRLLRVDPYSSGVDSRPEVISAQTGA